MSGAQPTVRRSVRQMTDRDAQVLAAVHRYTQTVGHSPSYRELAAELGIAFSSVRLAVLRLAKEHLVKPRPRYVARCILLTAKGKKAAANHTT